MNANQGKTRNSTTDGHGWAQIREDRERPAKHAKDAKGDKENQRMDLGCDPRTLLLLVHTLRFAYFAYFAVDPSPLGSWLSFA